MKDRDILAGISDVITDKPYSFIVQINNPVRPKRTLLQILKKESPDIETEREIIIRPSVVGTMFRIAGASAKLPDLDNLKTVGLDLIPKYMPDILYIVAAAIQNNDSEPDKKLIKFIEQNFTQNQIFLALYKSIEGVGLQSFINSIVLASATTEVLRPASPQDGSE
jgi:hypothetical protein